MIFVHLSEVPVRYVHSAVSNLKSARSASQVSTCVRIRNFDAVSVVYVFQEVGKSLAH